MGLFATDPVRSCPERGAQFLPKYYNEARTHLSLHKDAPIPRGPASSPNERSEIRDIPPECSSGYGRVRHSLAARSGIPGSQRSMDYGWRPEPGYRFAHPGYTYFDFALRWCGVDAAGVHYGTNARSRLSTG